MSDQEYKPSWRKPVGIIGILAIIAGWTFLIVSLSGYISQLHWALQAIVYTVAGIAWIWIFPMRKIMIWMETGKFGA